MLLCSYFKCIFTPA